MPAMCSVSDQIIMQPVLPMLCSKWGERGRAFDCQELFHVKAMASGSLTTKYSGHFLIIKTSN